MRRTRSTLAGAIGVFRAALMAILLASLLAGPLAAQPGRKPVEAPALPADMLGSWGQEAADCTDSDSEGRLHVTARTLEFFDSKLTISRVSQIRDGWTRVEGLSREQGKKARRGVSFDLRLKSPTTLTLRNGPNKPDDFVRCRPQQLQG